MEWINLAENRDLWRSFVNAVMNCRVASNAENFLTSWRPVSLSRQSLLHDV